MATILIIDDNVDMARGMARLLGLLGHEVQAGMDAGDADEAKASSEEALGGGAARSRTRASMASGPC